MGFDTKIFNWSSGTSNPLPVVTVSLLVGKKHRVTTVAGLEFFWDIRGTNNTIKRKHNKHYEHKVRSNKVYYSTAYCLYFTTHYVKVLFWMLEFFCSKIIVNFFHVNNYKGELGIAYDIIIGHDLMLQLVLTDDFKCQYLQWYGATLYMNDPSSLLGQSDLTKRKIFKVVMHSIEPASTQEVTEIMVKILYIYYAKAGLNKVADNVTQLNAK